MRFVRACRHGHIGDIDWYATLHIERGNCRANLWIDDLGTRGDITEVLVRCECGQTRLLSEAVESGGYQKAGALGLTHMHLSNFKEYRRSLKQLEQIQPISSADYLFKSYAYTWLDTPKSLQIIEDSVNRKRTPIFDTTACWFPRDFVGQQQPFPHETNSV